MADLDKDLTLKIVSDTNEANVAIDGLIDSLKTLDQKLKVNNISKFASSLKDIANAASSLQSSGNIGERIDAIASATNKLKDIKIGKNNVIAKIIPDLKELQGITIPNFSNLDVLADTLLKLQGVSAKKISSIATAIKDFGGNFTVNINGLDNAANAANSVANAASGIEKTTSAVNKLASAEQNAGVSASEMTNISDVQQASHNIIEMANDIKKCGDNAKEVVGDLKNVGGAIDPTQIKEANEAFNATANSADSAASHTSELSSKYSDLLTKIKEYGSAISTMKKNPQTFDYDKFKELAVNLAQAKNEFKEFEASFSKINSKSSGGSALEQEMQRISEKIKEVKSQMYELNDIRGNDGSVEYKSLEVRLQMLQDRYQSLNDIGKKNQSVVSGQKARNIDLLASLVALSHELEHVASTFDRWGNAGITLLKNVFLPLNVAFRGFKEKVVGMATAMKNLRTSMQKHLDKMSAFWKRTMKTFTFMLVRKAITAILNETKNAVDSLARWSNQFGTAFNTSMSEITANASYLARNLVAMFEPVINTIVPILNTLVEALARAARAVAEFFAAFTGQSYFMVAKKKVGNYAAELDKANKKQKQLTMGIDELNILNEGDSGSGSDKGAGFGDEWDTAPVSDKMKNLADEIKKILEKLFEPLKKAWDIAGDYVLGGFKYMKEEIGKLLASIGKDFLEVWNQPETVKMLTNLLYILGDIEYTIGNLAKGFREAWETGEKGKKIFEAIRDILAILIQHVRNVTLYMRGWSQNIDFNPLLEKALELLQKMGVVAEFVGGVFEDIMKNVVLKYIEFLIEEGIPHLLETIGEIIDSFDFEKLRNQLVPLEEAFEGMLENIDKGITNAIGNVGKAVGEFTQSEDFQKFLNNVKWFMDQITADRVAKLFTILGDVILDLSGKVVKFIGSDKFKDFMTNIFEWFDHADSDKIVSAIEKLALAIAGFKFAGFVGKGLSGFTSFLSVLASAKSAIGILTGIGSAGSAAGAGAAAAGAGGATAAGGFGAMAASIAPVAAAIGVAVLAIKSFVDSFGGIDGAIDRLKQSFNSISEHIGKFAERLNISEKIENVKKAFSDLMSHLGDMKDAWNILLWLGEQVGKVVGDVLVVAFDALCSVIQGAIQIIDGVIEVFGGVGKIIMGLVEGDFPKIEDGFMQILHGMEDAAWGLYNLIIQPFVDIVNGIIEWFKYLYDVLLGHSIIPDIIDGIVKGFNGMITTVVNAVKNFVTKTVNFFKDLWSKVVERATKIKDDVVARWNALQEGVKAIVSILVTWVIGKWNELKQNVEEKVRLLKESIIQKWEEIKSKIQEKVQQIKDDLIAKWDQIKADAERLLALAKEAIIKPFKDVWDALFGADGWITKTVGELVKKWEQMKKDATELLGKVKDAIVQPFKDAWNALFGEEGWITTLVSKFKKGLGEISPDMITEKLKGVGDAIVAPFKSAYEAAMGENGWVSQLLKGINGFFDGIKTAIENSPLGKFFENIADKIKGLKEKLDGLKSDAKEAEQSTRTSSTQGYFNGGIVQYATGGYPSRGTLFWAGEYGLPEMIGTVGGKTAVASSAEITGIRESVMESSIAEQNMMGQMINLLQAIAAKDLSVNMDSRELVSSLNDRARRNGYNFQMA